jgi:hypothetical protein
MAGYGLQSVGWLAVPRRADAPDVVHSIQGIHVEAKRVEALRLWEALAQAQQNAGDDQTGVAFHCANNRPWVAIPGAEAFLRIVAEPRHD